MSDYIETRDMMDKIRDYNKPSGNNVNSGDTNVATLTDSELDDEIKNFKEAVGGVVSFGDFIVSEGNISWEGKLDNENIEWTYNLNDNEGCFIKTTNAKLSDEVMERINNLRSYYTTWSTYWSAEVNG